MFFSYVGRVKRPSPIETTCLPPDDVPLCCSLFAPLLPPCHATVGCGRGRTNAGCTVSGRTVTQLGCALLYKVRALLCSVLTLSLRSISVNGSYFDIPTRAGALKPKSSDSTSFLHRVKERRRWLFITLAATVEISQ